MSTPIKIAIGVVVVVVLGAAGFALFGGGDDDKPKSASTTTTKSADKSDDSSSKSSSDSGSGPALRTLVVKRASGKNATAQAGALVQKPHQIWIRVSAAPKQEVRVTWSLPCGGGTASQDNYVTTPPHLRELKVPKNAKACAASVAAQLAKVGATGRIKVALLVDR